MGRTEAIFILLIALVIFFVLSKKSDKCTSCELNETVTIEVPEENQPVEESNFRGSEEVEAEWVTEKQSDRQQSNYDYSYMSGDPNTLYFANE